MTTSAERLLAPTAERICEVHDMRLGNLDGLYTEIENAYKNANGMRRKGLSEALDSIVAIPTIDAVPVVRCHGCIHRGTGDCPMYHEEMVTWTNDECMPEWDVVVHDLTRDDGFCDRGKRNEGKSNG